MDALSLHAIFEYLSGQALWWGLTLLCLSAMIEYIFPPFPGDTVTVVGAVMIPAAGWPWPLVFAAVIIGSLAGASVDWWVGNWVRRTRGADTWFHRFLARDTVAPRVDALLARFERWGSVYIALNRFIPAFRAFFFVAAGMAELKLWRVLFFAALSAAAWNAMLLSLGYLVGYQIDPLMDLVDRYTQVVWLLLGAGVAVWLGLKIWRRARKQ